jgi:hypothetical protein
VAKLWNSLGWSVGDIARCVGEIDDKLARMDYNFAINFAKGISISPSISPSTNPVFSIVSPWSINFANKKIFFTKKQVSNDDANS